MLSVDIYIYIYIHKCISIYIYMYSICICTVFIAIGKAIGAGPYCSCSFNNPNCPPSRIPLLCSKRLAALLSPASKVCTDQQLDTTGTSGTATSPWPIYHLRDVPGSCAFCVLPVAPSWEDF